MDEVVAFSFKLLMQCIRKRIVNSVIILQGHTEEVFL